MNRLRFFVTLLVVVLGQRIFDSEAFAWVGATIGILGTGFYGNAILKTMDLTFDAVAAAGMWHWELALIVALMICAAGAMVASAGLSAIFVDRLFFE